MMRERNGFRTIALIVACALFMENLDGSIILMALPQMASTFQTEPVSLSIAVTTYLLSVAVFIPASGWVADRFGARTIFMIAIVVFTLSSVWCGLSGSLVGFTIARAVQGLGGAMMVPVGRLVLMRHVEKEDLIQAMAYLTVPAVLAPVIGPPLGGFIVTYVSWRWIFFLNIPIGLLGMLLVLRFIEDDREDTPTAFDWMGFILISLSLSGMVFGLEQVGHGGTSLSTSLILLMSACSLLLYTRHAGSTRNPILDLTLLRIPTFRHSFIAGNLFRISVGTVPFLLPMMLQVGFGLTAFTAGLLTFVGAAGSVIMRMMAGPLLRCFGFRTALTMNGLLCALLLAGHAALKPDTPIPFILGLFFAAGFFRGLQFNGIAALTFSDIEKGLLSRATALASTAQQLSQSIGIAAGALLLNLTLLWHDKANLAATDFWPAFLMVAVLAGVSGLMFLNLNADAASDVSGYRRRSTTGVSR